MVGLETFPTISSHSWTFLCNRIFKGFLLTSLCGAVFKSSNNKNSSSSKYGSPSTMHNQWPKMYILLLLFIVKNNWEYLLTRLFFWIIRLLVRLCCPLLHENDEIIVLPNQHVTLSNYWCGMNQKKKQKKDKRTRIRERAGGDGEERLKGGRWLTRTSNARAHAST